MVDTDNMNRDSIFRYDRIAPDTDGLPRLFGLSYSGQPISGKPDFSLAGTHILPDDIDKTILIHRNTLVPLLNFRKQTDSLPF
jgi:hypothetical protein